MAKKKAVMETTRDVEMLPKGYVDFLNDLKTRIGSAQIKAAVRVNEELIRLYWEIGTSLNKRQQQEGWGAKTIEKLAKDLKDGFPDTLGFSFRNLKYMVQFAKEYPEISIRQQVVAQIPWGHNLLLLQRVQNLEARLWYAHQTIEGGWSRSMLETWIESDLYGRKGKAVTNFQSTLPKPQSDLADEALKDPYWFGFLSLDNAYREKELEQGLVDHIQKFLLELGKGFAFVGRQFPITVSGEDYSIDLLFYHLKLRCYVVIELKAKAFKPGDAGQMNFYLSAVDDLLRHPEDRPTIGLLLCKTRDRVVAEYALRNVNSPIGIAEYEVALVESLPKELKSSLPTIKEIEAELQDRE